MPDLAKHTIVLCLAVLIAGVSFNALATAPYAHGIQPVTALGGPELA